MDSIFVYGTLAPGGSRHDLLSSCKGEWKEGRIRALFDRRGWGYTGGYPAIILCEEEVLLKGWFLESSDLGDCWSELDEYEGEDYERVTVEVSLGNETRTAMTYCLHHRYRELIPTSEYCTK